MSCGCVRNPYQLKHVIFSLHAIVIGLILDGLGQMVGYVARTSEAVKKVARFEFQRCRHVTERDRREVFLT